MKYARLVGSLRERPRPYPSAFEYVLVIGEIDRYGDVDVIYYDSEVDGPRKLSCDVLFRNYEKRS